MRLAHAIAILGTLYLQSSGASSLKQNCYNYFTVVVQLISSASDSVADLGGVQGFK